MANQIISPIIFEREVIRNRDRKNVFLMHTNRDYEWDIKKVWDTVTVQILPTLNFTAQSITKIALVNAVAQVSTVTFTDGSSGDVYKTVINGVVYTLTDTGGTLYANATALATAMRDLINATNTIVTATFALWVLTLTAKSAGTAFTVANTGSTTVWNVVVATPTANVVWVSWNITGAGPWAAITATDFTITPENLVIDSYSPLRITLTKYQIANSNLSLEEQVAKRFAEAEARLFDDQVRDQILVKQVADIPLANKINVDAPYTAVSSTIFAEIEKMRVALAVQNVTDNLNLFVSPAIQSILIQSTLLDNTDTWLQMRTKGYIWMISWVNIYVTNALTASKEMIMMAEWAVNMVVKLNDYDVRLAPDGFYTNLIAELVWGLKIFGENAKAISINYVA